MLRLESERRRLLCELLAVEKLYRDVTEQMKEIENGKNEIEIIQRR